MLLQLFELHFSSCYDDVFLFLFPPRDFLFCSQVACDSGLLLGEYFKLPGLQERWLVRNGDLK